MEPSYELRETLLLKRQVLLMNYLSTFALGYDTPKYCGIRKEIEQAIEKIDKELDQLDTLIRNLNTR